MHSREDKKTVQRDSKANSVLEVAFIAVFVASIIFRQYDWWNSALYLTLISLVFAVLSGCVAFFYSKLPKDQRVKSNWISASDFSTHPYFTFLLFVAFFMIGVITLFI